jgi:hypothetical protein
MNPIFVKICTVGISAFMNIIGTIAIPHIGVGAISMLVLWNLFVVIITVDDHKRAERRQKELKERIDYWQTKAIKEQIKNFEKEENQK